MKWNVTAKPSVVIDSSVLHFIFESWGPLQEAASTNPESKPEFSVDRPCCETQFLLSAGVKS